MSEFDESFGARSTWGRWAAVGVGLVAIVMVVLFATRIGAGDDDGPSTSLLGQVAPEVTSETMDGSEFDIDAQRGRWVVINFWATTCAPCRVEHPELVEFSAVAGDRAQLLGVAFRDTRENVEEWFDELGGGWPVVLDFGEVSNAYGVASIPETFVISPTGVVHAFHAGAITADFLLQLTGLAA